jgi:hypothetical protein
MNLPSVTTVIWYGAKGKRQERVRMIKRIFIYIAILYITLFGLRIMAGEKPALELLLFFTCLLLLMYLGSYLIILGFEIKSRLSRTATREEIRKAAFWFSFWAGVGLATITTFYRGYPTFYSSLKQILWVSLGCLFGGVVVGLVGVAISNSIVLILKKRGLSGR